MPSQKGSEMLLPDTWSAHARLRGGDIAVVAGDRRVSWAELNAGMNRVANALLARGIQRGDKVSVLMGNTIDTLQTMFGIVKAGACVAPLSALLKPDQVARLITDSDAKILLGDASRQLLAEQARAADGGPAIEFVAVDFNAPGWTGWEDFCAGVGESDPDVTYAPEDDFSIIYSSGTTGMPKGIVHSHRARHHWCYSNAIELSMTDESVALTTTSLYSNGTWFMVLSPMFLGARIVIMDQFSPGRFLELVEQERVTHSFIVPTQAIMILEDPQCGIRDLSSLKALLSAGSTLRLDTRAAVEKRISANLYELYGFSEGFATLIKPDQAKAHPGSVGRPVVGFDIRIVDDRGEDVPAGTLGEIAGRGAGMMSRYYNRPAETAEIILEDTHGRRFLRGGDVGKLDADGFLYILDRKKDMIISGGFNVFPVDIEQVVGQHDAVLDVTVIGVPHPKWDETPLALVILREGQQTSAGDILAWANERLAKMQRLSAVEIVVGDFPRNALGKVLKRELRERHQRKAI